MNTLSLNRFFVAQLKGISKKSESVIARSKATRQSSCNLLHSLDRHASLAMTNSIFGSALKHLGLVMITLISLATGFSAHAAASRCPDSFGELPTLAGGREKPLSVHAKDVIQFITGKKSCGDLSAVEAYCELSLEALTGTPSSCQPMLHIEHENTRALLNMGDTKEISPKTAQASLDVLKKAYMELQSKKRDKTSEARDLAKTIGQIQTYIDLVGGYNWQLPVPLEDDVHWMSLRNLYDIRGARVTDMAELNTTLTKLKNDYQKTAGTHYLIEYHYDRARLPQLAMVTALLAFILVLALPRISHPALFISVGLVFALEIALMTARVVISGRGPVTNMYETMLWVGFGTLLFATILTAIRKQKIFLLVGLALNFLSLMMLTFAHGMLNASIDPLVPVLRDNFWLSTHVTTITISYAAFALSWGLANVYMIQRILKKETVPEQAVQTGKLMYDAIKIGVVLIGAGIILGGIWADYSWGRFWGWDPKETWALIALMTYLAILHGRHAGWIRPARFIPLVAAAFLTIIMAWFGVNYILASGLHSYGFSQGGTVFIVILVLAQFGILGLYRLRGR